MQLRLKERVNLALDKRVNMTSVLWLTVLVWWTLTLSGASAQENCVYRYTEQPPATLDCSLDEGQIQLKCKVTGPHDPRLGIRWFHNSLQLQNSTTFTLTSFSEGNNITSTLTVRNWEANPGSYHCQLSISGSTSQTIPSNSLVLGDQQDSPGFPDCQLPIFFQTEPISCASMPMTVSPSPSVTPTPMLLITSTTQTLVTSHPSLNSSPLSTPPPTVTTGDVTSPSTSPDTSRPPTSPTSNMVLDSSTDPLPTTPLQVWLYVVVAVAAVFAMIIIILVILCVGLCLRKSKTGDLETPIRIEAPSNTQENVYTVPPSRIKMTENEAYSTVPNGT